MDGNLSMDVVTSGNCITWRQTLFYCEDILKPKTMN